MPKMKWGDDFDADALDDIEYDAESDSNFQPYDGPIPPANTLLKGIIKRAWATKSKNGSPMIKLLWEAQGNEGEKKVYERLGIWHYVVMTKETAFSWKPFCQAFGLTASDIKNRMVVEDTEAESGGFAILKIGAKWKPGEKSAQCSILTKVETYNRVTNPRVARILVVDNDDNDEDDDDTPF